MNKRVIVFSVSLTALLFIGLPVSAQRIKLESGSLAFLKGQTSLNVEYVYDGLRVGKKTEEEYVREKVKEKNDKEPGTGDKWLTAWKEDRAARFQPQFEEAMNAVFRRKKLVVGSNLTNATYTLALRTVLLEPGFNVMGPVAYGRRDARIDVVVTFVKTADRGTELARINMTKAPGHTGAWGSDFDVGYRVSGAYRVCGSKLAAFVAKNARL